MRRRRPDQPPRPDDEVPTAGAPDGWGSDRPRPPGDASSEPASAPIAERDQPPGLLGKVGPLFRHDPWAPVVPIRSDADPAQAPRDGTDGAPGTAASTGTHERAATDA